MVVLAMAAHLYHALSIGHLNWRETRSGIVRSLVLFAPKDGLCCEFGNARSRIVAHGELQLELGAPFINCRTHNCQSVNVALCPTTRKFGLGTGWLGVSCCRKDFSCSLKHFSGWRKDFRCSPNDLSYSLKRSRCCRNDFRGSRDDFSCSIKRFRG
jgi:hypothetical protein